MILQVATGAVASFRTVQTAADGSYSFDNLKAKYYTLAAWKTGFVGRYYGVDTPNSRRRRKAAPGSGPARPYLWGSDGKLYAWFWSNRKRYVVATADSISEIDQPPSDVAAALARWKPGGVLTPRTQENTW